MVIKSVKKQIEETQLKDIKSVGELISLIEQYDEEQVKEETEDPYNKLIRIAKPHFRKRITQFWA